MANFLHKHCTCIIVTSAGLALGTAATLILRRITSQLRREINVLSVKIENLRCEVENLKQILTSPLAPPEICPKHSRPSRESFASDDDDDDLFEEAYDGAVGVYATSITSDDEFKSITSGEYFTASSTSNGGPVVTSLDQLLPKVDTLVDGDDGQVARAYYLLKNCHRGHLGDVEFLWRFAKATHKYAQTKEGEEKRGLAFAANAYVRDALKSDELNSNVHKWYAITLGSLGDYLSMKEKIANGYTFRDHIDKAMEINPDDPTNHHLRGRWCYAVYMLSWLERQTAAYLFATPPTSTSEEALEYFLKAESLQLKPWKENELFVAKCFIAQSRYGEALVWLDCAAAAPTVTIDDVAAQTEVDELLASYGGYRTEP